MTLQASGVISMNDVLIELRIANPGRSGVISLGDADVLNLAGKGDQPISLSDLYGKSSFSAVGTNAYVSVSSASAGTCYAYPYVTPTGGAGGTTYQWAMNSNPNGATLGSANSQQCQVSHAFPKISNGSFDVVLQCTLRDNAGNTITVSNISAHGDWSSDR